MRQHQVMDLLPQGFDSRRLHTGHASGVPVSFEAGFSIPDGDLGSRRSQNYLTMFPSVSFEGPAVSRTPPPPGRGAPPTCSVIPASRAGPRLNRG